MEDMQTVIILMTAVIVVHSVAIIILFSIIISLLLKRIASQAETAAHNIAQATEWLSPRKVFTEASRLFRRK